MKFYIPEGENYREVQVEPTDDGFVVTLGGSQLQVQAIPMDEQRLAVMVNHHPRVVEVQQQGPQVVFRTDGNEYAVEVLTEQERLSREMFGDSGADQSASEIRAPMPGLVLNVLVAPGDAVSVGQPLLIMEAMKMENEIRSTVDGVIKQVVVQPQQPVEKDELLIVLE